MKKWSDSEGEAFRNSDVCHGRTYNPGTGTIDVAKIFIRGAYPESGWNYSEEAHEMAVVLRGSGYIETKDGVREDLTAGDVVYIKPRNGDLDLIVSCGPAFDPGKYHHESEETFKFIPELTEAVKNREETATFRMEPKEVSVGDIVEMWTRFDENATKQFGYAKITGVQSMPLGEAPLTYPGHKTYASQESRLERYKQYYGDHVTLQSTLYIYDFEYLGENYDKEVAK